MRCCARGAGDDHARRHHHGNTRGSATGDEGTHRADRTLNLLVATAMTVDDVIRRIGDVGIVPVVRAASVAEATRAVEAIYGGGIPLVEITMTVPNAVSVIREVAQQYRGKVLIGAG